MSGRDRNKPCWCGSQKKYKRCHYDRESQTPLGKEEEFQRFRRAFDERICLHPKAPGDCSGAVVRAHTVQRACLAKIAVDGHVMGIETDVGRYSERPGQVKVRKVGLRDASTITGFCNKHDAALFQAVEGGIVNPTRHHALLLAYRAICREVLVRRGELEVIASMRELDRGASPDTQARLQAMLHSKERALKAGSNHLEDLKRACEADLSAPDASQVRFLAVELDTPPDLMLSGACRPRCDCAGRDLRSDSSYHSALTVSLLTSAERGLAMLAWIGEDPLARELVGSFARLADDDLPHALVRLAFEHFDNLYWSPRWWAQLTDSDRNHLLNKLTPASPYEHRGRGLKDDGLRLVNWRVTGRTERWE